MPNASLPASYVAGAVTVPANTVANLLDLIQQQITPNCPGTATEFQIVADAGNSGSVAVGSAGILSGPLSATNYAYKLTSASGPRLYRASYPGTSTPIGELQVLATNVSILHIEVQA